MAKVNKLPLNNVISFRVDDLMYHKIERIQTIQNMTMTSIATTALSQFVDTFKQVNHD